MARNSACQQLPELRTLQATPRSPPPAPEPWSCPRDGAGRGGRFAPLRCCGHPGIASLCTPGASGKGLSARPRPVSSHQPIPSPAVPRTPLFRVRLAMRSGGSERQDGQRGLGRRLRRSWPRGAAGAPRGSGSGGVPSPVLEGEHQCEESPAGIGQPLVTAGEKQDLVLGERRAEQVQHIGDAWGGKERRALRNEGSPLAAHLRPLNPPRAGSHPPSPRSAQQRRVRAYPQPVCW